MFLPSTTITALHEPPSPERALRHVTPVTPVLFKRLTPLFSGIVLVVYPAAIFWTIISVAVNAVDFKIRCIPVSNSPLGKCLKVVFPFVTYTDTFSTVILPVRKLWICTPVVHSSPDIIKPVVVAFSEKIFRRCSASSTLHTAA